MEYSPQQIREFETSIQKGDGTALRALLALGYPPDLGGRSLSLAVVNNRLDVIDTLVLFGLDVSKNHGFHQAFRAGKVPIIKKLLAYGYTMKDKEGYLLVAITRKDRGLIGLCLKLGAEVCVYHLVQAVKEGDPLCFEDLLECNPDLAEPCLLRQAVGLGHFAIVKLLVEAGADFTEDKYRPLLIALRRDRYAIALYLSRQGYTVTQKHLYWAINSGNLEFVRKFIEGDKIEIPADKIKHYLQLALEKEHTHTYTYLLESFITSYLKFLRRWCDAA